MSLTVALRMKTKLSLKCHQQFFAYIFSLVATQTLGGPTPEELLKLLDQCDLSNSYNSTPCLSPCISLAMQPAAQMNNQSQNQEHSETLDSQKIGKGNTETVAK